MSGRGQGGKRYSKRVRKGQGRAKTGKGCEYGSKDVKDGYEKKRRPPRTNRNEPETFDGQEEAFHIYYKAPRLYIAGGGARGTLYGVYAFLETYLGWRWFAPDTEKCVLSGTVEIPADCNLYCRPALE